MKLIHKLALPLAFILSCSPLTYGMDLTYDGQVHPYNGTDIQLVVNEVPVETTVMPPVLLEGRILVPAREVFNELGAEVDFVSSEHKVYITYGEQNIVLTVNSQEALVNNEVTTLDVPAKIINDKLMLPIRFISEALNFEVNWTSPTVSITAPMSGPTTDEIIPEVINPELPEGFSYDAKTHTLCLENVGNLKMSELGLKTDLMAHQLIISCPLPQSEATWEGQLDDLKGLHLQNSNELILNTTTVCEASLQVEEGKLFITLQEPKDLYAKRVVIDAGHGGYDVGSLSNDTYEKDITLACSNALYGLLEANPSLKVFATRTEDVYGDDPTEAYPTLTQRVTFSNEIAPDLFISIHLNAFTDEAANGTETYYAENCTDEATKAFAASVQEALVSHFNTKDRSIKAADLQVLTYNNSPAILLELGFITNPEDRSLLTSESFPQEFAQVIYDCILKYYETR